MMDIQCWGNYSDKQTHLMKYLEDFVVLAILLFDSCEGIVLIKWNESEFGIYSRLSYYCYVTKQTATPKLQEKTLQKMYVIRN